MKSIFSLAAFYILIAAGYRGKFSVLLENQTLQVEQDNMQLSVDGANRRSFEKKCCCKLCERNDGGLFLQSDDGAVCCKKVILPKKFFQKASCTETRPLSFKKVRNPRSDTWSKWSLMKHVPSRPVVTPRTRPPPVNDEIVLRAALTAMSGEEVGLPWQSGSVSFSPTDCSVNLMVDYSARDKWVYAGSSYRYKIPAILAASVSALRRMKNFPTQSGYLRTSPPKDKLQKLQTKLAKGTVTFEDYDLSKETTAMAASHITQVLKDRFKSSSKKLLDFVPITGGEAQNLSFSDKNIVSLQMQPTDKVRLIIEGQGSTMLENTPEPFRTTIIYWFDFCKQIVDGDNQDTFTSLVEILANMEVLFSSPPEMYASPDFAKFTRNPNGVLVPKKGVQLSKDGSDIKAAMALLKKCDKNKKIIVCELWKAHHCSLEKDVPSCVSKLVGDQCNVK